jgi:hypothetical protein
MRGEEARRGARKFSCLESRMEFLITSGPPQIIFGTWHQNALLIVIHAFLPFLRAFMYIYSFTVTGNHFVLFSH